MPAVIVVPPLVRRRGASLALILPFCVGYYVSYLLRTVNAVIAPELMRELGLDLAALGLLTSTYSLAFGVAQLPVGLALDRYGARRVVSTLLVVATAGTIIFATGHSFTTLAIGRGLAGLGVSACLMGGFKVFGEVFPPSRQAQLTGVIMAAGTSGALTASLPLEWALPVIGWRGSLVAVAVVCAVTVVALLLIVPSTVAAGHRDEPPRAQIRALFGIMKSRPFWRFGPQATLFTGGFMALQGLWISTWLTTLDGRSRAEAATSLLLLNLGLVVGQVVIVLGAAALHRVGLSRQRFMITGLLLALLVEGLLVARLVRNPGAWFALGLFNAVGAQVYGVASGRFPRQLAGRVSTAINLFAFAGAFLIQWGMGLVVQALGGTAAALQTTFAALWIAQVLSVLWTMFAPEASAHSKSTGGQAPPFS